MKPLTKKRKLSKRDKDEEDENVEDDSELQAEIEAVMAIRAAKEAPDQLMSTETKKQANAYNSEALLKCVEGMGTSSLPFLETLQISEFSLTEFDENDDLEREVSLSSSFNAHFFL